MERHWRHIISLVGIIGACKYAASGIRKGKDIDIIDFANGRLNKSLDMCSYNIINILDKVAKRRRKVLLPSQSDLGYHYEVPTLILNAGGVLGNYKYTLSRGWHMDTYPGLQEFVKELSSLYEMVLWSDDARPFALQELNKLNLPVLGVLHSNDSKATKIPGEWCRSIEDLGRDINTCVVLDSGVATKNAFSNNVLTIGGEDPNTELLGAMVALKSLGKAHLGKLKNKRKLDFQKHLPEYQPKLHELGRAFEKTSQERQGVIEFFHRILSQFYITT